MTDTVTQNFEAGGRGRREAAYRFSDRELIENIRLFEASRRSSRLGGAAKLD